MSEVTVKDFFVGAVAYIVMDKGNDNLEISECRVVSVGRRYVKVTGMALAVSTWCFGVSSASDEYLAENIDYGWQRRLFPTKEQATEYIEREDLKKWCDEAFMWPKSKKYTLDQLRRVKAILEEKKSE